jgi:sulfide dehydrogenase cytochrome subunit
MRLKVLNLALFTGGMVVSASLWAAGPSAAMLSHNCGSCHGTLGASVGPSNPILAGQPAAYIVESMKKFKSGERPSTVMGRLAKGYSDDEFRAMGEFFEAQKFVRHPQPVDAAKVAKGKQLHDQNCKKCHQEGGRESEDGGVLAGQWKQYLQINMDEFQSGKRPMPKKMADKFQGLSKEDLEALVNYYASQQ